MIRIDFSCASDQDFEPHRRESEPRDEALRWLPRPTRAESARSPREVPTDLDLAICEGCRTACCLACGRWRRPVFEIGPEPRERMIREAHKDFFCRCDPVAAAVAPRPRHLVPQDWLCVSCRSTLEDHLSLTLCSMCRYPFSFGGARNPIFQGMFIEPECAHCHLIVCSTRTCSTPYGERDEHVRKICNTCRARMGGLELDTRSGEPTAREQSRAVSAQSWHDYAAARCAACGMPFLRRALGAGRPFCPDCRARGSSLLVCRGCEDAVSRFPCESCIVERRRAAEAEKLRRIREAGVPRLRALFVSAETGQRNLSLELTEWFRAMTRPAD